METELVYSANTQKYLPSELGDEMILLDLKSGDYISLNAVSAEIWKLAVKNATAEEIIAYLLDAYEIDAETCQSETLACIDDMIEKELLLNV